MGGHGASGTGTDSRIPQSSNGAPDELWPEAYDNREQLREIIDECFESTAIVDGSGDLLGPADEYVTDECINEEIRAADLPRRYLDDEGRPREAGSGRWK